MATDDRQALPREQEHMAELAIPIVNHNSVDPLRRCPRSVMSTT
jgi:hypothetical protein